MILYTLPVFASRRPGAELTPDDEAARTSQVVYEWGLDTATALSAAVRKKQVVSPAASPRIAMTVQSPLKPSSMGSMQRSNSGFSLNKLIKGRAA